MIDVIRQPIEQDFAVFQEVLERTLASGNIILSEVSKYLKDSRGKEMRPMTVLLSSAMFGKVPMLAINVAVAIEMLHTASLLHDDVVDESLERHSKPTVNAVWKNKVSILSGDFYLANSLKIVSEIENIRLIRELGQLGASLADGELLQMHCAKSVSINEDLYYDIIYKKTARTFSFSSFAGAVAAGASEEAIQKLKSFGKHLGMSFQIRDDIFDYLDISHSTGKPMANDLRDGKQTLPLIYALRNTDENTRNSYLSLLLEHPVSEQSVAKLYQFAKENGGIEYAQNKMEEFRQLAIQDLADFPDSPAKKSLLLCLDYSILRTF